MEKRQLNVKVDSDVFKKASEKISKADVSMAFLVETLLQLFIDGKISIEKKTVIEIKSDPERG